MSHILYPLLCSSLLVILAGCSHSPPSETPDASMNAPELSWDVLPSVPVNCLVDKQCSLTRSASPLEIANPKLLNEENPLARLETRRSSQKDGDNKNTGHAKTSFILKRIEEIYGKARLRALDAQDPNGSLKEVTEKIQNEPKQLPERPLPSLKEINDYRHSKHFLDCQSAYYALEIGRDLKDIELTDRSLILGGLYTRYVNNCFQPAPKELLERFVIFSTNWQAAGNNEPLGVYCLGFDLDGKHIVTAKHCLADPSLVSLVKNKQRDPDKVPLAPYPGSRISFGNDLSSSYTYKVSNLHVSINANHFNPSLVSDDLAVVEVDTPRQLTPFPIRSPQHWDRVVIFTTFIPYSELRNCKSDPAKNRCNFADLIRIDPSPNCVSPVRLGECLLHACHTRPGSSGGPILSIGEHGYALIGIHTGSIDDPKNAPCRLPRGEYYRNYGVSIDSSAVMGALRSETGR